jgi:hypothetical protein
LDVVVTESGNLLGPTPVYVIPERTKHDLEMLELQESAATYTTQAQTSSTKKPAIGQTPAFARAGNGDGPDIDDNPETILAGIAPYKGDDAEEGTTLTS